MVLNRTTESPLPAPSILSRSLGHNNNGRQKSSNPVRALKASTVRRRGFGLFSDDEEDEENTEIETESPKRLSVSFSGNKSGFEVLEKVKGKGRMSMDGTKTTYSSQLVSASFPVYQSQKNSSTPRNSRNSPLTTPKRSGRAQRTTPYSTTTSRALQRAKASQKNNSNMENHEDQLIADTSYEEPQRNRSPYTMHGAREVYDEDEEPTDEDPVEESEEQDFRITPTRNIFSRTNTPVKTPAKSPKGAQSPPATGKKTWGQWLGAILPESVKKPVKAILGTPEDDMEANVITPTKELVIGTPKKDEMDEDNDDVYSLPGSFGKPEPQRPSQSLFLEFENSNASNSNGFNTSKSFNGTPSRVNDSGLFTYDKPKALTSTAPSRRERRSTMSTPIKTNKAIPEANSLRKPNNFIERMRSAKKTQRYDPYSRKTPTAKSEKAQLTQEEEKVLTPEEKLKLLKQRQKERKIAELEDKYEMRETLKAMGQPIPDEDESMPDSDTEVPKGTGTGEEKRRPPSATVEDVPESTTLPIAPGSPPKSPIKRIRESPTAAPPKSPIKRIRESPTATPPRNLFSPSTPAPSFLLNPDTASTEIPFKINTAPPPTDAPTINFNSAPSSWSFTSDSSDKENILDGPPPPPTMSHATLPAPLTTSASPSQPPALSGSLFGSQPAGGFGLGLIKESTAVVRQRSAAEKFKPIVSSSLRESRSVADEDEKENAPDKENAGKSGKKGEGEMKKKGLSLQQQGGSGSSVFVKPALKENAGVLNLGKSEVKVDIRKEVEAIPVKHLVAGVVWPGLEVPFGEGMVREAVENMWRGGGFGEYQSGFGELFAKAVKV